MCTYLYLWVNKTTFSNPKYQYTNTKPAFMPCYPIMHHMYACVYTHGMYLKYNYQWIRNQNLRKEWNHKYRYLF